MTTPGYPDWQSYAQWRSNNLLTNAFPTLPAGATSNGPYSIQNFSGVFLEADPLSGAGAVSIDWYLDAGTTIHVGADTWNVSSLQGLRVLVPARGTFFVVTFNNQSGGAAQWQTEIHLTNTVRDKFTYPVRRQRILQRLASCPASGTLSFNYSFLQSGPTWLWFQDNNSTGKLALYAYYADAFGSQIGTLYYAPAPVTIVKDTFQLAAELFIVTVTNSDAVSAHPFDLTLVTPER